MTKIISWKDLSIKKLVKKAVKNKISLARANSESVDLSYNFLCEADFRGTYLEGANFKGAVLTRADLRGANIKGANFEGADIKGIKINKDQMRDLLIGLGVKII